ncbi:MAG TPA: 3-oxoacyl-ACP reductase FabG [Acidimicrobiales bacterium]|nr:3-oxoacyl-ACP reductase FabG [Acidimicrobiales bacterium]
MSDTGTADRGAGEGTGKDGAPLGRGGRGRGDGRGDGFARVALVTGGSGAIGRATAAALAAGGYRVAVGYGKDRESAEKGAAGIGGTVVQIEVTDVGSVEAAYREVEESLGPVAVLVNNAGVNADGLLMRMSDDQWRRPLSTSLDGAFNVTRRAVPGMVKARWGRIVNMSSVTALSGSAGQANYAAAKAGLIGFSRSMARELAARNVTCNVVAPGPIVTAMTEALSEQRRAEFCAQVPLGRMGTPDEVGALIAFLCSESAAYITGAVVPVDGGLGMGH